VRTAGKTNFSLPLISMSDESMNGDDSLQMEENKTDIVDRSPKGRFIRFNDILGAGAYKNVYRGYDNESGCEIAWSNIKLGNLSKSERKRITEEIQILQRLEHPNILHFIKAWLKSNKEEVVFITEIVTGGSLKQ
jgi:WNK lysine deficient protein kinase